MPKKLGMPVSKDRLCQAVPNVNNVRVVNGQSSDKYKMLRPNPILTAPAVGLKGKQK